MIRAAALLMTVFAVLTAFAQKPVGDPDDFLDPRARDGRPVFISRLVAGFGSNMSGDGFRPLGKNIGYVHLANSFSWRFVQIDYKRTQMKSKDGEAARWEAPPPPPQPPSPPDIDEAARVIIITPQATLQTRNATPKSKDTFQAAWYWPAGGGVPVMLRSRITFSTQPIESEVVYSNASARASGRERTFALDTDTWFRIAGHDVFGSLAYSETKTKTNTSESVGDRDEHALAYTNRFSAISLDRPKIVIRPTLTVGGISNRNGPAVNLVNPAIEFFRPFARSGANLHVIYSPQWVADGERWKTTHQVAVVIERALFFKVF